jgi:hypothetical protein
VRSTGRTRSGSSRPSISTSEAWYVIDSEYGVWWSIPHSFDVSSTSICSGVKRTFCCDSPRSLPAKYGRSPAS